MPKETYIDKRFHPKTETIIHQVNEILDEYAADDLTLTLRQLYYQFVAHGLIPNKQEEYDRLGAIVNNGRLAGLIDWNAIEDRTRNLEALSHWTDPGEIIRSAAHSFQVDHWEGQEFQPEVWIEKEALVGVIVGICEKLDIPYFACRGYVSQSEMWRASKRFERYRNKNRTPIIIHLGDHDPSGIDMTRDIDDRQKLFIGGIIVKRIALNMDQIEEYSPPPNPAKVTDSRFNEYSSKFGNESWELDALEPRTLQELIEKRALTYRDDAIYEETIKKETEYKSILDNIEKNWESL